MERNLEAAVIIFDKLYNGIEIFSATHILKAPMVVLFILAAHYYHSVVLILWYDFNHEVSVVIQALPQIS